MLLSILCMETVCVWRHLTPIEPTAIPLVVIGGWSGPAGAAGIGTRVAVALVGAAIYGMADVALELALLNIRPLGLCLRFPSLDFRTDMALVTGPRRCHSSV